MAITNILADTQTQLAEAWGELGSTLGSKYSWYQPNGANNPISPRTLGSTFLCYFDRDPGFTAKKASEYGKPEWYVAYDRGGPTVGSYLKNQNSGETYAIIDQADLTPSKVIQCNRVLSFYRNQAAAPDVPTDYYSGNTANEGFGQPLAIGWPASVLQGQKGEKALLDLPEDARKPWFTVLVPVMPGVTIKSTDTVRDEDDNRYTISSVEKTTLGYRMTVSSADA
jgi:hypothetical protein